MVSKTTKEIAEIYSSFELFLLILYRGISCFYTNLHPLPKASEKGLFDGNKTSRKTSEKGHEKGRVQRQRKPHTTK